MTDCRFWIKRLEDEKADLDRRIGDLLASYDRAEFGNMSVPEKQLMMRQGVAMEEYSQCLGYRINKLKRSMEKENG